MIILRLFHQNDPFRQVEERPLADGELVIGREAGVDWLIDDPELVLSRRHCVIARRGGRITLRDISANGVFLGEARERAVPDESMEIKPGETLRLGRYLILVDQDQPQASVSASSKPFSPDATTMFDAPFAQPILQSVAVDGAAISVPSDWADAPSARPAPTEGSLLDAFCAGAKLDASAFAGEEAEAVMRRVGAVYQQMVLGLADLMGERTAVKTEYRMSRTTVRAHDNNPFKWTSPQRLAVDLLRDREDGFLTGPRAVRESYEDLKKHVVCMLAGLRAAVAATADTLAPDAVDKRLEGRSFVFKGRSAAAWEEYEALHAEVRRRLDGDPDSPANRAFREAYERQLQELDALCTRA
jgi:predicted component of type VI protein secretion system